MIWQIVSWYFLLLLLGWLTFPLAYRLFRGLPDRAYSLSRVLGLLLWGFVFWFLASLNILQNNPGSILFGLALLIGASIWAGWGRWQEIWMWVKDHRRLIVAVEIVFLAAFGFMVLVRACDPYATGTEKPMELAFINAILNSDTFPPHDPWLSGYAISYYHFGYILTAMLAKVTLTSGGVAFNLMLAAVFSMSAAGAYGILYNLVTAYGNLKRPNSAIAWAILGPIFLLFISNFEGVLEMLHQAGIGWDMATGTSSFWQWVNIESLLSPPAEPLTLVPQRFWWWWQASRVVQDIDLTGVVNGLSPIDEFPAFSFVLGDLHPHVLVMPFVMLTVGLAFNIFRGGMDGEFRIFGISLPYKWDLFLLSSVLIGGIAFLNTWDLPVYLALLTGAFLIRRVYREGWTWERFGDALKFAVPLGVLALLLYLPFLLSFQSQAGGIMPNLVYPTRGLYIWIMFGPFLILFGLFFIWLRRRKVRADWGWGSTLVIGLVVLLLAVSIVLGYKLTQSQSGQQLILAQGEMTFGGLLGSALMHRLAFGAGLLTLTLVLILGAAFLLGQVRKSESDTPDASPIPFILLMVVLGGVMILAPEFVYLRDNFGARMNTVFKFYYQGWMLWSLAAAYMAVVLLRKGSWLSRVLVLLVILAGLAYPALAYTDKTNGFRPVMGAELDAGAYLATYAPDEAAAIAWLADAPDGTVAEAVGGQYSGYARVATLSGQPNVLGWPGHEGQWRGGYAEVGTRQQDIQTLFETNDWDTALAIIRQYEIKYIFFGSLESSTYIVNPTKFDRVLEVGFEQGNIWVYVVPETYFD
jgi:YYY domain-containing protein